MSRTYQYDLTYDCFSLIVQISDFGLATYGGNHNRDDINPSGTVGYVAAEYLLDGTCIFLSTLRYYSVAWILKPLI
jgi:hypothetical protein